MTTSVWEDLEPYRGITPESRFQLSAVTQLPGELTLDRLDRRLTLLEQIEHVRRQDDLAVARTGIDRHRSLAFDLLRSGKLGRAFDLALESDETRDLYGMTLFGQASLTARRLVEAGGRFVTVFWDEYGLAGTGWDTHWDHFPRMKDELLPGLDQTFSGLLIDLDRRGMLDETLVVLLSEHGRTPKLASVPGRRPRPLVALLFGGDGRRRRRAGPGRRPVRQDRQRSRSSERSRPRTSSPRSITCWVLTRAARSPIFKAGPW